jgi:hypothetical protein
LSKNRCKFIHLLLVLNDLHDHDAIDIFLVKTLNLSFMFFILFLNVLDMTNEEASDVQSKKAAKKAAAKAEKAAKVSY